ncbi:hypothetical protein VNI00_018282 [Paramarasmius palmivorus]|uniref:Uncharacterized protein n=1 Tax=Paramarasmius palmivorus TaxID=297713 RepID=A0AAW0AYQ1_9AGAR
MVRVVYVKTALCLKGGWWPTLDAHLRYAFFETSFPSWTHAVFSRASTKKASTGRSGVRDKGAAGDGVPLPDVDLVLPGGSSVGAASDVRGVRRRKVDPCVMVADLASESDSSVLSDYPEMSPEASPAAVVGVVQAASGVRSSVWDKDKDKDKKKKKKESRVAANGGVPGVGLVAARGLNVERDGSSCLVEQTAVVGQERGSSPVKGGVRDLTGVSDRTRSTGSVGARKSDARLRERTSRRSRVDQPVGLVSSLDAIDVDGVESSTGVESDLSYCPAAKRKRVRRENALSVLPVDDVEKKTVSVQVGGLILRPLTDSEDDLPSPSTVFSSGSTMGSIPGSDGGAFGSDDADSEPLHPRSSEVTVTSGSAPVVGVDERVVDGSVVSDGVPSVRLDEREKGVFLSGAVLSDAESDMDVDDGDLVENESAVGSPLLDEERIHPDLRGVYSELGWADRLQRSKFIGYSTSDTSFDDFAPVSYGGLLDGLPSRVRSKLVRSMLFVEYRAVKNPVRLPLSSFVRSWECLRVPHAEGTQNAVFVLTGVSLRSYVSQGREVGQSYVKQLHVRPLENDWDLLQCNVGTFFNDSQLHAPGRRSALIFQTKRQGWSPRQFDKDADKLASTPYSGPSKGPIGSGAALTVDAGAAAASVSAVNVLENGAPPYRLFDDGVPLYDGRTRPGTRGFRFLPADWDCYTRLPLYPHPEVDDGSLVTVAFTLTGFRGTTSSHHTVHFNALFAIVLGKIDG